MPQPEECCLQKLLRNNIEITQADVEKSTISGEIHFFFSVDMREFLTIPNSDGTRRISDPEFEKLQGSKEFAKALREMESSLGRDKSSDKIRVEGFNNGIFGGVLSTTWLKFPTFCLEDDDGEWLIRCSWMGLFEIRLTKTIHKKDKYDFDRVISEVLKYRTKLDEGVRAHDEIWGKVFKNINIFCRSITKFNADVVEFTEYKEEKDISFNQRQRYVLVVAKDIICQKCKSKLPAPALGKSRVLSALLYSSLVSEKATVPEVEKKIPDLVELEVKDLSTWDNEICVFGSERGFIYYDPNFKIEEFDYNYKYDDHWKWITRGVQHSVTVRAVLQSLQNQIRKVTDQLPELLASLDNPEANDEGANPEGGKQETNPQAEDLAHSLANVLQIMPQVSSVCIPTVAFRANYAVDKFRYLNDDCFDFPSLLAVLRRDITDASNFLAFSKSYQLQKTVESRRLEEVKRNEQLDQSEKRRIQKEQSDDRKREYFAMFVAVAAILFIAPTAIKDGAVIFTQLEYFFWQEAPSEEIKPLYILPSILIFLLVGTFLYIYRKLQYKKQKSVLGLKDSEED